MEQRFDHIGDHELDPATKQELRAVTNGFFERPLEKAEQFDWDEFKRNEAFKAIMMPSPLFWVLANFERSFTQKLGQQMYEAFGQAVAETNAAVGSAATQHACTDLELSHAAENRIETIIAELADADREPDWQQEQAEIKTPKPNRDQTMESKRQMLQTVAAYSHREEPTPICRYVFPFNPYGSLADYEWWPPQAFFDVQASDGMLIAEDFWDALGGPGTMDGLFNFLLEESEDNIEKLQALAGDKTL